MVKLKKIIQELVSKKLNYYLNNIDKIDIFIFKCLKDKEFMKLLNENDLSNLSEIVGRITFIKFNNKYPNFYKIDNDYEFTEEKEMYDIVSEKHKVIIELKNRRKDLNIYFVESDTEGCLFKVNKWYKYRQDLSYNYFYNNILDFKIWSFDLNSIKDRIEFKIDKKLFVNKNCNNKTNSEKDNFIHLKPFFDSGKELIYDLEFKNEIEYLFYLNFKIELLRSNLNNSLEKFKSENKNTFNNFKKFVENKEN